MWPGLGANVVGKDSLHLTGSSGSVCFLLKAAIRKSLVKANRSAYESEKTGRKTIRYLWRHLLMRVERLMPELTRRLSVERP